ncbi:hypothetical protein RclHR1_04370005 [Rhizophagus clarus]|uniref:Uncharacterized protein n=1 Tax=Rhizophagus clarus TaxID=94130 RepID=A0A2Z6RI98_9GLOM|nr:hypothetical protein RclHR1_04370005 [Rhizophagus clarus]
MVIPIMVIPITITDDSKLTVHSIESTKNIALMGNMVDDLSDSCKKGKETNFQVNNINDVIPPKPSEDNKTSILLPLDTSEFCKKKHGGKQKKANKQILPTALTTDAPGDETKGQLQLQPSRQSAQDANKPTAMKGIINIPAVLTLLPAHEDTISMDLNLIDLKAPHKDDEQIFHAYGTYVNPYIQDLKSLSEDTFMTNSSTNGTHDQIADPSNKDASDDHPIDVFAALDNLMIISDETPLLHSINYKKPDLLFTPKHSFLPNCQQVSEEIQVN